MQDDEEATGEPPPYRREDYSLIPFNHHPPPGPYVIDPRYWTPEDQHRAAGRGWWLSWLRGCIEGKRKGINGSLRSKAEVTTAQELVVRLAEEGDPTALKALRVMIAHVARQSPD